MRAFLSGPITSGLGRELGHEEMRRRFVSVEVYVRHMLGERLTVFNPVVSVSSDSSHEDAMSACVIELGRMRQSMRIDAERCFFVRLPGWETSEGARLENDIAQALGIPVYDAPGRAWADKGGAS